jgi:membrane protein DedA with SNARE-associated domain
MQIMISALIAWLEGLAQSVSLEVFVLIGGLVEEIIAPIPSPLVATLAGSIAVSQGWGIAYLLWICFVSTISKTMGAWIFFFLGGRLERLAIPRLQKYIGVRDEDIQKFGARFTGKRRDILLLAFLRSIPVMPSTPVSLACGMVRIAVTPFVLATFVGFYVRNLIFMVLGFTGLSAAESLMGGLDTIESALKFLMVLAAGILILWLYWKRRTSDVSTWVK